MIRSPRIKALRRRFTIGTGVALAATLAFMAAMAPTAMSGTLATYYGIIVLNTTAKGSLNVSGSSAVATNGFVLVDSNNPKAVTVSGTGTVSADTVSVTGGIAVTGNGKIFANSIHQHQMPFGDPLDLPLPAAPNKIFAAATFSANQKVTLNPGTYVGGIHVSGNAEVTLSPGVYYMQGGGFTVAGHGAVNGTKVMIVNAPGGGGVTQGQGAIALSGNAVVTLTPINNRGFAYNGIVLFQDPNAAQIVSAANQSQLLVTGIIYAPGATFNISESAAVLTDNGSKVDDVGAVIVSEVNVTGD